MAWLKQGDAAANHPIVLAALELEDADDRILNECFGFVARCATQAAAFEQDYIVTVGTARQMAGSFARFEVLAPAAKYCGYWTEVMIDIDGTPRKAFKLVEDNDLFHMILKAERAWNNQRKKDFRNPELTVAVRLRDGDACRYCGKSVAWGDNRSGRGATYDHLIPGEDGKVNTMVVCCRVCNGKRQDDPDSIWKALPAPAEPLYGPATVAHIQKHGTAVQASYVRTPTSPIPTSDSVQAPHPVEQQNIAAPGKDDATATPGSSTAGPTEALSPESNPEFRQRTTEAGNVGSGRDGTGRVGKGRGGSTTPHPAPPLKPSAPPTGEHPSSRRKRNRPRKRNAQR